MFNLSVIVSIRTNTGKLRKNGSSEAKERIKKLGKNMFTNIHNRNLNTISVREYIQRGNRSLWLWLRCFFPSSSKLCGRFLFGNLIVPQSVFVQAYCMTITTTTTKKCQKICGDNIRCCCRMIFFFVGPFHIRKEMESERKSENSSVS